MQGLFKKYPILSKKLFLLYRYGVLIPFKVGSLWFFVENAIHWRRQFWMVFISMVFIFIVTLLAILRYYIMILRHRIHHTWLRNSWRKPVIKVIRKTLCILVISDWSQNWKDLAFIMAMRKYTTRRQSWTSYQKKGIKKCFR